MDSKSSGDMRVIELMVAFFEVLKNVGLTDYLMPFSAECPQGGDFIPAWFMSKCTTFILLHFRRFGVSLFNFGSSLVFVLHG